MLLVRICVIAVLLAGHAAAARAQQSRDADAAALREEAPLRFRYLPWVDAMVTAIHMDGVFYLPASEIFRRLGIAHELQHGSGRIAGSYLDQAMSYSLDAVSHAARIGGRTVAIHSDEVFIGELDLFVAPAVLERLFGWRVTLAPLSLELRIEARELLPVATAAIANRRPTAELLPEDTSGTVRFARRRQFLNGAMLDYAIAAEHSSRVERYSLDFLIGAEVLGGELQARFRMDDRRKPFVAHAADIRWRYVLENSAVLSQATIGRVLSSGLRSRPLYGLQLTNHPIEPPAHFGTQVVQGTTGAEWDVEISVNERVTARTKADPFGRYRVHVPMGYGAAAIRIRHLGPAGEVREEENLIEVPFTFLPSGRITYLVTAGNGEHGAGRAAQAEVGLGLTSWLTARSGAEYDDASDGRAVLSSYHNMSARLGSNRTLAAKIAPSALTQLSAEWRLASRGHLATSYTRYRDNPRFNQSQLAWEWDVDGYVPVSIASLPITLRGTGGERASGAGARTIKGDAEAILNIGSWMPSIGYRTGAAAPHGEIRTTSLFFVGHRLPAPLRNALVRASYARPLGGGETNRFEVGLSTQLTPHQRIEFAYAGPRSSRLEMRMQLDSRPLRATTTVRRQSDDVVWSQSASGSIAVDPRRARATLSGRPLVGRAGVSVRFFLDQNGNGRFDRDEAPVPGASIRFDRVAVLRSEAGELTATELLPYQRYRGRVETRMVPNPLWLPQFRAFSFVADPNTFQTIEVPFFAAGTAQGAVVRRVGKLERPVAGLKVHVLGTDGAFADVISTFADGSFYHEGLPPGRYVVKPDAAQLDILGVTSDPLERTVDLQHNRDGASIDGLDFVLLARVKPKLP